jgi:type III restriction enzyme
VTSPTAVAAARTSADPEAKKQKSWQLELATEWTSDRLKENDQVNQVRARVRLWRKRGYPDVTPTTRQLLGYCDPERDNPILFCQREAAETAIYLAEGPEVWRCLDHQ